MAAIFQSCRFVNFRFVRKTENSPFCHVVVVGGGGGGGGGGCVVVVVAAVVVSLFFKIEYRSCKVRS